ncbi:MAG: tRNA (adenosine(37)-N6)-threonylcarbamoyltransferase complex ATPase subunit type 1 TsaE [Leptospira sp.]|nr:tRNA (adenosine(37)-N6)-threonylcarbamoyltransferase complex ATPase subunit type 1 TsaE [Leptospira sp.]
MNELKLELGEDNLKPLFEILTPLIQKILNQKQFPIILLSGDLGAGKTTLVRKWMESVGSNDQANSPTFTLQNIYDWKGIVIHHFDLYRIKSIEELEELGFEDIWGKVGICFIEWWQIAENLIPSQSRIHLNIETIDRSKRIYNLRSMYL